MDLVVLCDFDGTIVEADTCTSVLHKFAKKDWRAFDKQFGRGEITLEECLQKQFATVTVSKAQMLKEAENAAFIRPGLEELVRYCKMHAFPLILVSAGLDFVIKDFLRRHDLDSLIEVYAPKTRITNRGIRFMFPKLFDKTSVSFKDDLVKFYRKQGKSVVYIGDGQGDYYAAGNADYPFAIKGSRLAELLKKDGIAHKEISDFWEVVEVLDALS
jgi:2,3-diketo-5-methylthio-1-phosphopentane phosphatase